MSRCLSSRRGDRVDQVQIRRRKGACDIRCCGLIALRVLLIPLDLNTGLVKGVLETLPGRIQRRMRDDLGHTDRIALRLVFVAGVLSVLVLGAVAVAAGGEDKGGGCCRSSQPGGSGES